MIGVEPVVILTDRLKLRPFREDDWVDVHEYAVDPEISRYQDWGPNSVRDTKSFVAKCIKTSLDPSSNTFFYSIAQKEDDRHIGGCVLTIECKRTQEASIGYTVGRKYWNQGFATEAASALLEICFTQLGIQKVTSNCDSSNYGSWRVMEKLGMNLVHTAPHSKFFKGGWRDWLDYAIEREEWNKRHSPTR